MIRQRGPPHALTYPKARRRREHSRRRFVVAQLKDFANGLDCLVGAYFRPPARRRSEEGREDRGDRAGAALDSDVDWASLAVAPRFSSEALSADMRSIT